jgi:hypothetical protein
MRSEHDMLTGQPAYRPAGDVARAIAREIIERRVRERMTRGNLVASLGEMRDDGTVALTITAQPEQFDVATYLEDHQSISGIAWIEDRPSAPIHVWYSFPEQEYTPAESDYADRPPAVFWLQYGRDR